jgi:hypothetical protein
MPKGLGEMFEEALEVPPADAATIALDQIARVCGCPEWDYPLQVVRDVERLADDARRSRDEAKRERAAVVAFLRKLAASGFESMPRELADEIERGEHCALR